MQRRSSTVPTLAHPKRCPTDRYLSPCAQSNRYFSEHRNNGPIVCFDDVWGYPQFLLGSFTKQLSEPIEVAFPG